VHYQVGNDHGPCCKSQEKVKCFHHHVCNTVHLFWDLGHQLGLYYEKQGKHYHEIIARSQLLTNHMQGYKEHDELHIDYIVPPLDVKKETIC
jgi:hypothetical protein